MERHLATHHMKTPAPQDVVLPHYPTPSHDVEPIHETPASSERLVAFGAAVMHDDRALEHLGAERIAELRNRLATGAYNSPEVMTELAVRLLESGDLES